LSPSRGGSFDKPSQNPYFGLSPLVRSSSVMMRRER
jgi:hypothetical protein